MSEIKCQYADHNEQQCLFICIDPACTLKKRIACFQCFQDQKYHLNHQGLTIQEFQQKVNFRLQNLKKLQTFLSQFKEKFNFIISQWEEDIKKLIFKGNEYLKTEYNNIFVKIDDYYRYESDLTVPYLKFQLEKMQKKIDKIKKYINNIKYYDKNLFAQQINEIKVKAMNMIIKKDGSYEDAIQQLNKGLKIDPVNCSLISLKSTCLININQIEKAKILVDYAFDINQNDETVLLLKSKLMLKEKQYYECLKYYELSIEPNQYLAFQKLDSLQKLNYHQEFQKFKQECQDLFGNNFNKEYEDHQKMQTYD
ncbi:unnamed protein product [Paramecium primaurelia]|uniref:Tetratricopeptide repeat protein n=1 Tax=Paramecium primaurelia TaxID=5886 RepID=A0A8S1KD60_PARPR|nr:unnamed protein product [Paramecium primaurelia]